MNRPLIRRFASSPLAQIVLIALAALLVYSNTFNAPMTFDDTFYIVDNTALGDWRTFGALQHTDLPGFGRDFLTPFRNRTVAFVTFALNYRLGGLDPTGYHMVNLLIHISASLMLYWLTVLLFQTPKLKSGDEQAARIAAFCAALLFACHPLQTQAVTYISQRFTSLAALFYLGALAMYVRSRLSPDKKRSLLLYLGSAFMALLAVRTKEISFTLPLALVLVETLCLEGWRGIKAERLLPWIAISLIIPATLFYQQGSLSPEEAMSATSAGTISSWDYFLTQQRVIVTYMRLLILPINQNLDYDYPVYHSIFQGAVLGSILLNAAFIGLAVYLLRRSRAQGQRHWRWASFGIFWFYLTLSVESSFLPLKDIAFEHRMYLPLAGVSMALSALGAHWAQSTKRTWIAVACAVCIITALGATSFNRNSLWGDPIVLWQDVVSKSPLKARSYIDLGAEFDKAGDLQKAAINMEKAASLNPKNKLTRQSLGMAYQKLGLLDKAIKELNAAMAIDPTDGKIHYDLGWTYAGKGMNGQAIEQYTESIRLGSSAKAYNNLGNLYIKQRQYDQAVNALARAVAMDPADSIAYNNLGTAYSYLKKHDLAIKSYRQAIRLDPSYAKARYNLITKLIETGEQEAARAELPELERIDPALAKRIRPGSGP